MFFPNLLYFDAKDINIDLTDPDSLLITRAGLSKAADVILGYCDKEHFDRTCKILDDAKELFDTINEQLTYYKLLDNKTLRKLKREEIVSRLEESYVSAANSKQPLMFTV